jgi:hypothetical protein
MLDLDWRPQSQQIKQGMHKVYDKVGRIRSFSEYRYCKLIEYVCNHAQRYKCLKDRKWKIKSINIKKECSMEVEVEGVMRCEVLKKRHALKAMYVQYAKIPHSRPS